MFLYKLLITACLSGQCEPLPIDGGVYTSTQQCQQAGHIIGTAALKEIRKHTPLFEVRVTCVRQVDI